MPRNHASCLWNIQKIPPRTFFDDGRKLLGAKVMLETQPEFCGGTFGSLDAKQILNRYLS